MFLAIEWSKILTEIILAVVGLVISSLGAYATYWINTKIKSDKGKKLLGDALNIVSDGVNYTYQTYVDEIKGGSLWDKEAQQKAKEKAFTYIKTNLSEQVEKYIMENFNDVNEWINNQIEITIQKDKN